MTFCLVQLSASLRALAAQADRMKALQAELSNVEKLKAELEKAKKYNVSLVNDKAAEKLRANGAVSLLEPKAAELEKAKQEKTEVEERAQALAEEREKLLKEVEELKEEKEQISALLEDANRQAGEAAGSLEGPPSREVKIEIMQKWFASRDCEVRDLFLGEQMRYKVMDLAVKRILDRHPHLDVSDIDLKMNPGDPKEPSYFYGAGPALQMFTYEQNPDFTFPEDESVDEGEEEEERRDTEVAEEAGAGLEAAGSSPGPYADLDNIIPASDVSMEDAGASPTIS